jgi:class 3 adenylate cyclase
MSAATWIATAAGSVAILAALIGLARFVFQASLIRQNERLDAERAREHELRMELDTRYNALHDNFLSLKLEKAGALLKQDIDARLLDAMDALHVKEASVLIPGPPPNASSFVFLSIFGPAAATVKRTKLPIDKGIVSRVFASGRLNRVANASGDPDFFDGIDRKGDHETLAMLTLPLCRDGRAIGVVQFLNKPGGFPEEDETVAEQMVAPIVPKVAAFVSDPENFGALDLAWRSDRKEATIAFCDLTASTSLLSSMDVPSAIDCINEYLEQQCDVAMQYGATVDKYTGDGVILRFNVPRPIGPADHVRSAVEAALQMRSSYQRLRKAWLAEGLPVGPNYSRIGLSCGPVYEATIGHPQFQQITVIGAPVNAAANLCKAASRDHDVIVVDERVLARLDGSFPNRVVTGDGALQPMHELLPRPAG